MEFSSRSEVSLC